MAIVFLWIVFVVLAGVMASKRNRSVVVWVLVSLFLSPLVGILFLLALGQNPDA